MTAIRLSLGSPYNALPRMKTVRIYFSSEFTPQNPCCKSWRFKSVDWNSWNMRFTLLYDTNVHGLFHHFLFPGCPWLLHRASCLVQGNPSVPVHNVQTYVRVLHSRRQQCSGSWELLSAYCVSGSVLATFRGYKEPRKVQLLLPRDV